MMTKTGPVESIDDTGPSPPITLSKHDHLPLNDSFWHVLTCSHPLSTFLKPPITFLNIYTCFWHWPPIFNLFKYFQLSSSIWMCCHILSTTLEWLNIFLTTHTHSQAPPPIFKLNCSFSTNFTLFDYFHPFLTVFTLFLIDFTHSQSLLFIFQPFLVNFDCSCLNLSVTTYFLINFICFLTVFDQF